MHASCKFRSSCLKKSRATKFAIKFPRVSTIYEHSPRQIRESGLPFFDEIVKFFFFKISTMKEDFSFINSLLIDDRFSNRIGHYKNKNSYLNNYLNDPNENKYKK